MVSGGVSSEKLICDLGGVFSVFGPATRTFIERELACPLIPTAGQCLGDTVSRCATPDEGGYRPLTTDCSQLGLTCGVDETGALGCVEPPPPLSCEGLCGGFDSNPDGTACYCDATCTELGDCCADFAEACPAPEPAPEPEPAPAPVE